MNTLLPANPDEFARLLGWCVMCIGGISLALATMALLLSWAMDLFLRAVGETRRVWWDVFLEMRKQGKLRWQKGRKP